MTTATRTIQASRDTASSCKAWLREAELRMLMNNLLPDVAERPDDLVIDGGSGKAAPVEIGPFRRAALAGDPEDIHVTDEAALDLSGQQPANARCPRLARERVTCQGLPARVLWLARGERERLQVPLRERRAC